MSKEELQGVWRTVSGRRIFIRSGESLGSAMARSGKFKENGNLPKRSTLKEAKLGQQTIDIDKRTSKERNLNKYKKLLNKDKKNIIKNDSHDYLPFTKKETENLNKNQAQKNRINENANIEGSGKTRVQRNWNKYSEEDRREHRHELIQKKLADYKAKKQSNIRDYKQEQKDLLNDMSKLSDEQLKEYRDIFKEQGKNKFVERIDKHLESRKQSNNKIEQLKNKGYNENEIKDIINDDDYRNGRISREKYESNKQSNNKIEDEKQYKEIIKNAKETAMRNGYDQYIYKDKADNTYSFSQVYDEKYHKNEELIGKVAFSRVGGINKVEYKTTEQANKEKTNYENKKNELIAKLQKEVEQEKIKNYVEKKQSNKGKYTVDYWKSKGVDIKDKAPNGYIRLEGATTAPNGYEWYSNGKSRFSKEYKHILVRKGK